MSKASALTALAATAAPVCTSTVAAVNESVSPTVVPPEDAFEVPPVGVPTWT